MAKKTLQIGLNQGSLDERIILDYLDCLDVITGVVNSGRGTQNGRDVCCRMMVRKI